MCAAEWQGLSEDAAEAFIHDKRIYSLLASHGEEMIDARFGMPGEQQHWFPATVLRAQALPPRMGPGREAQTPQQRATDPYAHSYDVLFDDGVMRHMHARNIREETHGR